MRMILLFTLLLSSLNTFAREELHACRVRIVTTDSTVQAGVIYSRSKSIYAEIFVDGPVDVSKSCDDTKHYAVKRLPVRISAKNSIGVSLVLSKKNGHTIKVGNWDGNTLEEIIGNYTGVQAGLSVIFGMSVDTFVKTDFNSVITLRSAAGELLGGKVDLSLVNFSLEKDTASKSQMRDWGLVLRKHH